VREIKFRAWDKKDKVMYYGVEKGIDFDDQSHYEFKNFLGYQKKEDYHEWEIMQYTGLKDKNGVEIYERDIVVEEFWNGGDGISEPNERDEFEGVIIWDKETCCFGLKTKGCKEDEIECNLVKEGQFVTLEIIGNTMENKELLEGK